MKNLIFSFFVLLSIEVFAQPAGALDSSFGTNGSFILTSGSGIEEAHAVSILADGSIIVAGFSSSLDTGKDFLVLKLDTNGDLDETFGVNGIVTIDVQLGSDDIAYAMDIQNDGKIVLAGSSDNGSDKNAAIVRLNADGTLDDTFSADGKVLTDFESNQQDEIKTVEIHNLTGNIIVGGSTTISSSLAKPVVARYTSDGELDVAFNTTGIKLLWVTNLDDQYVFSVEDLAVQSNGRITAVGWRDFPGLSWSSDHWACRINADGAMDATFSADGVATFNSNFNGHDRTYAMVLQSDNSLFAAGGSHASTIRYDFRLHNIAANGVQGGSVVANDINSLNDDIAYDLLQDASGKWIMLGQTVGANGASSFALAQHNTGGSPNNTFGNNSKITSTFAGNAGNGCYAGALQEDQKIIAVGFTGSDLVVARYLGIPLAELNNFNLLSPSNTSTNQLYTNLPFNWGDAFGATGYVLEYDTDPNFGSLTAVNATISGVTVGTLQPSTLYYWRVKATDGTEFGDYSDVWSFTTKDPVGIEELQVEKINSYPNPASSVVMVNISTSLIGIPYQLINNQGQIVRKGKTSATSFTIEVENLSAGTYVLNIGDQSTVVIVER